MMSSTSLGLAAASAIDTIRAASSSGTAGSGLAGPPRIASSMSPRTGCFPVDTPGSGPLDKNQMIEMVTFLQKLVPQEVHLAISVTTSVTEMKSIIENFGLLKPNRILYTKLDETGNYGQMLSFAITSGKPMSYVTFGQNVPGDFSLADPESLIRKNLGRHPG